MRWLPPLAPLSVRSLTLVTVTQILCVLTVALYLARELGGGGGNTRPLGDLLVALQVGCATAVYARAARTARTTLRTLFGALAIAAVFATLGHLTWGLLVLAGRPVSADIAAYTGLASQSSILIGFAAALGRQRERVRFEVLVDALLLVVAAAIVIVELESVAGLGLGALKPGHMVPLAWSVFAEANLILLALLLAWRGDALGKRIATAIAIGTVSLVIGNFFFSRDELYTSAGVGTTSALLWTIATFCFVAAASHRQNPIDRTSEEPAFAADAARIRIVAIVVAILIAAWTALELGMSTARRAELGVAVGLFGVLLAIRTGYALWQQQRTATVLERTVVAERELTTTLEHRVVESTSELARAQRVLQRMWTLGQQIALELNPARVLERFVEAVVDVVEADGASVGLLEGDSIRIARAVGVSAPLKGRTFRLGDLAMGAVARSGRAARYEDASRVYPPPPSAGAAMQTDPVRGMAIVPLLRRGERIGAVAVTSRSRRSFTDGELTALETMADLLSVALANAELVENLRQAEWRFRTLFRAAPDAVLTIFESGRIREANDAVRDVLGFYPLQVIGRSLLDFVVPEDRPRVEDELAKARSGSPVRFEALFLHDGAARTVSLAARLLPEADPPTVLCVGRDMTVEREMRARLAETERLAAVGELVAGVAHEVNNPLSTISAFAQLLLRDSALGAEHRESVDVIRGETLRASQVVKDLLTFARRSESRRLALDLNDIVERAVRVSGYELSAKHIEVAAALAPELPSVFGDPRQLQQVVLNLVANAIQAMSPQGGGTLRVTTRVDGDRVLLEVADTGPGVPEHARAHIFEPFFTTKQDGTGLGLSVSYGIVTAHGGTITVARTGPDGTAMRVSLRGSGTLADATRGGEVPAMFQERSVLEGIRLLFVDDEPALRNVMLSFGKMRNFTVTVAHDGVEALGLTRRESFDAVVCDLRMPGMDGPAFYEALRRENPTLAARTIFITGDVVGETSRSFLDTTTQPVLVKPFEFERVEEVLVAALEAEPVW
ncbi:MAG: ATP-binding protein [Gemmatimonadota bacterium]|nr:ATP-binding protein [Gemmatimonadota bacterium]